MPAGRFRQRGSPVRVVFDGQSLNDTGVGFDENDELVNRPYPEKMMHGRGVPWARVSIDGTSWTTLATTVTTRLYPQALYATSTVLVMCGGTADINAADSGATAYADFTSYASAARANGFDKVIACTIPPAVIFDGTENTQRLACNTLIRANSGTPFDAIADLDVSPLNDYTDTDYYFDGLHWWEAGCDIAAAIVGAAFDSI